MWHQYVKKTLSFSRSRSHIAICLLFGLALLILVVFDIVFGNGNTAFFHLAQSFLAGRLDLTNVAFGSVDTVDFLGKVFWPLGPFPAVLHMPFILFGISSSDGFLIFLLTLATLRASYLLTRKIGFSSTDSLWSAFAFVFASPMLGIVLAPRAHYLSHSVVVLCLVAALVEYFGKRRYLLIGMLYAIILATRATAAVSIVFFFAEIIVNRRKASSRPVTHSLMNLFAPSMAVLVGLLWYNFARFGSLFEFGYGIQNLGPDLSVMRAAGMFSLVHLPTNLYYFLLSGPLPVTRGTSHDLVFPFITYSFWGVGLIYTAPYFFSLIWKRANDRINMFLWIASGVTAVPILLYYGIGPYQLGYRYALDFLPLVYCIFLRTLYTTDMKLVLRYQLLFTAVFILNIYLFLVKHFFILWDQLL